MYAYAYHSYVFIIHTYIRVYVDVRCAGANDTQIFTKNVESLEVNRDTYPLPKPKNICPPLTYFSTNKYTQNNDNFTCNEWENILDFKETPLSTVLWGYSFSEVVMFMSKIVVICFGTT